MSILVTVETRMAGFSQIPPVPVSLESGDVTMEQLVAAKLAAQAERVRCCRWSKQSYGREFLHPGQECAPCDPSELLHQALDCIRNGSVQVLVDGARVRDAEEPLHLTPESRVVFLRLPQHPC